MTNKEKDVDIRIITLKTCYAMEGYQDLPLKEKNRVYDSIRKRIETSESRSS